MKSAKSFFEFWIKIVVRAATRDKRVTFYVRAFATIFIPYLLQFPLMAHGKDGHDVVNSGLVPGKRISESAVTHKAVSDIGKLGSKSNLVGVNGVSQPSSSVLPIVDSRINQGHEKNANGTKKVNVGACKDDTIYFHILLSLMPAFLLTAWWGGYGSGRTAESLVSTPNVELRGCALLRSPA